jgi:hypothetical protein
MCFPSVFPVPDQGTTILSVVSVRPMVDVGLVIETSGPENQANKNQAPKNQAPKNQGSCFLMPIKFLN